MFRLLTNEVYYHGIQSGYTIITYHAGILSLQPFEKEIHSTVFVPGPVAILSSQCLDEFLLDDIELMITKGGMINDKKKLDDYLKASSLYYEAEIGSVPIIVKIGNPSQIIPIS